MIVVSGHIEVPLHDLSAVKAELINHIALTRAERGCITFSVTQRPEMPTLFDVYEAFDSMASFEAHQTRVSRSKWAKITERVQRHYHIQEN